MSNDDKYFLLKCMQGEMKGKTAVYNNCDWEVLDDEYSYVTSEDGSDFEKERMIEGCADQNIPVKFIQQLWLKTDFDKHKDRERVLFVGDGEDAAMSFDSTEEVLSYMAHMVDEYQSLTVKSVEIYYLAHTSKEEEFLPKPKKKKA